MPWRLIVSGRAERDLAGFPERMRESIRRALARLVVDPGRADLRKLEGRESEWRLWAGRWRVILELDNESGLIIVERILPRGRAYRR